MKWLHALKAKLTGKNSATTPKEVVLDQMAEARPLPMGREEFMVWSDRIISGSLLPGDNSEAFIESQKFTLAEMLLHLGKTESHKPDAYFIHALRKGAINQVAVTLMTEWREKAKQRKLEEEAKKAEATANDKPVAPPALNEQQTAV